MTSPPLDSTQVERRRAWHAIIAFGQHARSNDVQRGMPSSPLGAQMVERRPAWHAIITFGLAHIVRQRRAWHVIIALRQKMRSNDVGRSMPSSSLSSTHGRTTSGVASHHRLCTTLTIERRRAWHAIIAFGKHTRSDDVRRGMPS